MHINQPEHAIHKSLNLRGLLLVFLVGGWLVGILTNAWLLLPPPALLIIGMLILLLLCFCWQHALLRLSGLVLLCLCLGAWRYSTVTPNGDAHAIRTWIGSARLQVQGEITDDPRLESHSTLLMVETQSISLDHGQSWQEAHGQIQVQLLGATFDDPYSPRYGDKLQLEGKLSAPPGYATPELQASMAFPSLSLKGRAGFPVLLFLYQARSHLAGILMQALPQPFAALLIAILTILQTVLLRPGFLNQPC